MTLPKNSQNLAVCGLVTGPEVNVRRLWCLQLPKTAKHASSISGVIIKEALPPKRLVGNPLLRSFPKADWFWERDHRSPPKKRSSGGERRLMISIMRAPSPFWRRCFAGTMARGGRTDTLQNSNNNQGVFAVSMFWNHKSLFATFLVAMFAIGACASVEGEFGGKESCYDKTPLWQTPAPLKLTGSVW